MSEFECCGELMSRDKKTGKLTCPVCGSNRPQYMDGKTNKELRAEDLHLENDDDHEEDKKDDSE